MSSLPDGTYTAIVQVQNASGLVYHQGSSNYVKGAGATKTVSVNTVEGTSYTYNMSVTASSRLMCPIYSDYTNIGSGAPRPAYVGVMGPQGLLRYNLLPAVPTSGTAPTTTGNGCG